MMKTNFVLHPHFYAEENLLDRCFMNEHMNGVLPLDEFIALKNHRGVMTQFVFEEDTPVGSALDHITKLLIEGITKDVDFYYGLFFNRIYFLSQGERYYPENIYKSFAGQLKYLDPNNTGIIEVEILVCLDAGQVWSEDSLRFNMHSHEGQRHNEPHVHVRDIQDNSEASLALSTQEVLCGELRGKKLKVARKIIKDNSDYFYHCWNTKTDGLVIDIDHHFGLINY